MFNESKYSKWYFSIISRAKLRNKPEISERHHIVPKSMGGTEIVYLTPKEHFVCHLLLTKMTSGKNRSKMLWALHRMLFSKSKSMRRYVPSSRTYERFRVSFYSQIKGKPFPISDNHRNNIAYANKLRTKGKTLIEQYGEDRAKQIREKHSLSKSGKNNGMFGKKHSSNALEKISNSKLGKNYGRVGEKHPCFGKKLSDEHRSRISKGLSNRPKSRICVDGVIYDSVKDASKVTKIKIATLYFRAKSKSCVDTYLISSH